MCFACDEDATGPCKIIHTLIGIESHSPRHSYITMNVINQSINCKWGTFQTVCQKPKRQEKISLTANQQEVQHSGPRNCSPSGKEVETGRRDSCFHLVNPENSVNIYHMDAKWRFLLTCRMCMCVGVLCHVIGKGNANSVSKSFHVWLANGGLLTQASSVIARNVNEVKVGSG
jgi:hypothetical protein